MFLLRFLLITLLSLLCALPCLAESRTVYRCVRAGTVSLSTAPEPGSRCEAKQVEDSPGKAPNLWGSMGVFSGTLYQREQDGHMVYGTRNLPGSTVYLKFTVETPPGEPAHPGLGKVGKPRLDISSVPTLFEQIQLISQICRNFVLDGSRKQLIQRDSLEHRQAQDL